MSQPSSSRPVDPARSAAVALRASPTPVPDAPAATDLAAYIASLEEPGRAEWQQPDRVIGALKLAEGQVVCDIGAGPGYFALRAARAVGPTGHVFAEDVEPTMIGALRDRVGRARLTNVTPILGLLDDPLLPAKACDVTLIVNTYHHFPNGTLFLRRLVRSLKAGGRIVNVDFHRRETPHGPPVQRRVSRESFLLDARRAGLRLVGEEKFLPYQYVLILQPAP